MTSGRKIDASVRQDDYRLSCLGMINSLGCAPEEILDRALALDIERLTRSDRYIPGREALVAAVREELPEIPKHLAAFRCRNNGLALAAYRQIQDTVQEAIDQFGPGRIGVVLGSSTSGIGRTEEAFRIWTESGELPTDYDYVRQHEMCATADFLAALAGISGPACTHSTACSSSTKTFASARFLLEADLCDAVIVGGVDSLCRMTVSGFSSLQAISDEPSVPMSRNRRGFNVGEGAALFLLVRNEGPVRLAGVGESSDAHHISAPDPEGKGARACILAALKDAGLQPDQIDYINLHGTGTRLNDAMESAVVHDLFGAVPCSSSKPLVGHSLGAAGAVEAGLCWLMLTAESDTLRLLPHYWDHQRDDAIPDLHLVASGETLPRSRPMRVLSNSFAFGGNNGTVILESVA